MKIQFWNIFLLIKYSSSQISIHHFPPTNSEFRHFFFFNLENDGRTYTKERNCEHYILENVNFDVVLFNFGKFNFTGAFTPKSRHFSKAKYFSFLPLIWRMPFLIEQKFWNSVNFDLFENKFLIIIDICNLHTAFFQSLSSHFIHIIDVLRVVFYHKKSKSSSEFRSHHALHIMHRNV